MLEDALQSALSRGRRGDARGRAVEHHRRAHLQHFDLKGGGYTVDGACASSLLAVANACSALAARRLDVALAGGVDLSLDPFELVGFAKTGALAPDEMRVYDARSAASGRARAAALLCSCGREDAVARGAACTRRFAAGAFPPTAPAASRGPRSTGSCRASPRLPPAGFGIDTVGYFEGHGTGTAVGDATELAVLSRARREARPTRRRPRSAPSRRTSATPRPRRASRDCSRRRSPFHTDSPADDRLRTTARRIERAGAALRVAARTASRGPPIVRCARASARWVSAASTRTSCWRAAPPASPQTNRAERRLALSPQDAELFLLGRGRCRSFSAANGELLSFAARLSFSRTGRSGGGAARNNSTQGGACGGHRFDTRRARQKLKTLRSWLLDGERPGTIHPMPAFSLGTGANTPRIGFLFPGQGRLQTLSGGFFARRFPFVRALYEQTNFPAASDGVSTGGATRDRDRITGRSARSSPNSAFEAEVAVGHSLGELRAPLGRRFPMIAAFLRIARERGRAMAELGNPTGAMAAIAASAAEVESLALRGESEGTALAAQALLPHNGNVSIVGYNSPRQTVIAG